MVAEPAGHRWRLTLQRLMLSPEIIPSDEEDLHGRIKAQALGVAIGSSKR